MKVLFVCSGNICRSPMAAEYMRHRAARSGLDHVVVDSAGTLGIDDAPATDQAIRVLGEFGVDLVGHRSKGLQDADVQSSDLVIGMTHDHLEYLATRHPGSRAEHHLLRAFEDSARPHGRAPDLPDPIGRPYAYYREQFETIRAAVDHLVLYLRHAQIPRGSD